jgi:hypothetical protein
LLRTISLGPVQIWFFTDVDTEISEESGWNVFSSDRNISNPWLSLSLQTYKSSKSSDMFIGLHTQSGILIDSVLEQSVVTNANLLLETWGKPPWLQFVSELYRPRDRRLSEKLVPTFADRGWHVVSVTDFYGRNLYLLDRSRYVFFQVAPRLYSRG